MGTPNIGSHLQEVASTTVTYEGWAVRKGAATSSSIWKIRKITYDENGDFTKSEWADGNELYDNEWDNRATTVVYS